AGGIVFRLARNGADFMKAVAVEQRVDPFAHGEPAAVVLALHLVDAAHLARQRLTPPQIVQFGLPIHAVAPVGLTAVRFAPFGVGGNASVPITPLAARSASSSRERPRISPSTASLNSPS